ncbi:MAG: imidazole glycerol phosphate synthase subunit HisF, partial [Planctomycetota bacterium]|nr:imidazole glycerol phosphate synthase subunit HisF [Planctomycetota bacterium]
ARHLADVIELGGADAALAAGIFHFGECTIRQVKELFEERGIPVRPAVQHGDA